MKSLTKSQIYLLSALALVACLILGTLAGTVVFILYRPQQQAAPPPVNQQSTPAPPPTVTLIPTITPGSPPPTVTTAPRRPTFTPRPTPTNAPLVFEGEGDDIWTLTVNPGGPFIVSGWHLGEGNYIVEILDKDTGDIVDLAMNCVGDCEDSRIVQLPQAGEYLVEVMADGPYMFVMERP